MPDFGKGRIKLYGIRPAIFSKKTGQRVFNREGVLPQLTFYVLHGLTPPDRFEWEVCDEVVEPVDYDTDADFIIVSSYTSQLASAIEIADRFQSLGKPVILGGIHATAAYKDMLRIRDYNRGFYLIREIEKSLGLPYRTDPQVFAGNGTTPNGVRLDHPFVELQKALARDNTTHEKLKRHLEAAMQRALTQGILNGQTNFELGTIPEVQPHIPDFYDGEVEKLYRHFDTIAVGLAEAQDTNAPERTIFESLLIELERKHADPDYELPKVLLGGDKVNIRTRVPPNRTLLFEKRRHYVAAPMSLHYKGKHNPYVPIEGGMGCPLVCSFCSVNKFFGNVQYRDPEMVVDEVRDLVETHGALDYFFVDDNINLNPRSFESLCDALAKYRRDSGEKFTWTGQLSIRPIVKNPKLMRLAAEAGCIGAYVGAETIDEETLKAVQKPNSLEELLEATRVMQKSNIVPAWNMILGLPNDTKGVGKRSADFLREHKVAFANTFTLTLLPGTELMNREWNSCEDKRNQIKQWIEKDWRYCNSFDVTVGSDTLSVEEVEEEVRQLQVALYADEDSIRERCSVHYQPGLGVEGKVSDWVDRNFPFIYSVGMNFGWYKKGVELEQHLFAGGSDGPFSEHTRFVTRRTMEVAYDFLAGEFKGPMRLLVKALKPLVLAFKERAATRNRRMAG